MKFCVLRPPFCTLTTHYWLKLGRWGWLMRMRLAWKNSQKTLDTSKRWCQLCHYWELQTRKRQGRHSLDGPVRGWNPYPGAPPTTGRQSLDFEFMGTGTCMNCSNFWCTKFLWLIMPSLVHAALVLFTTVVNYYSWLHHSINYNQGGQARGLVIVTNSNNYERDESKNELFTFRNSGLHLATVRIFTTFLVTLLFFVFDPSNQDHCQWCASKAAVKIHMVQLNMFSQHY